MTTSDNPYASPQVQPPPPSERPNFAEPRAVPSIGKSFLKWTLACGIAAAPSFFIASSLVHRTGFPAACGGMIAGIVVFIILYVFAERTQRIQRILSWRFAKRTAWIGYGTRIAVTFIFPVGMTIDMICGMVSVSFGQLLFGANTFRVAPRYQVVDGDHVGVFLHFMLTTIVQGVLLNVVLFGYMLLVFGICHLFASFTKPR